MIRPLSRESFTLLEQTNLLRPQKTGTSTHLPARLPFFSLLSVGGGDLFLFSPF
ncbi:unnamed protein product [Larinioides sclopetarius]|uniref:Uncharacterized protein n=1 Tax=Larinioides sclopetarius TaxID=280406 RepID=A0AAV2AYJ5_9ARAC